MIGLLTFFSLDVSGSKRILLNVEVTPDLSHRPQARPAIRRRSGLEERVVRCEDDITTEESERVFTQFSVAGLDILDSLPPLHLNTITSNQGEEEEEDHRDRAPPQFVSH